MKIAFQGVAGAYSEQALLGHFGAVDTLPCEAFEGVFEAVRAGAITVSSGTILLEAASSQCRLPLEAARKTINSGISRGFSS